MGTEVSIRAAVFAAAVGTALPGIGQAQFLESASSNRAYSISPVITEDREIPGIYSSLEVDLVHDDNIQRTDEDVTPSIDSLILDVRPELLWVGLQGKHRVRLNYKGHYAWYEAASNANFDDHYLGGDVLLDLTPKLDASVTADIRREHEPRGTLADVYPKPNLWEQWNVAGEVVYGRRIARAQVSLNARHFERDYINNGQSARDYDADAVTLTFFYNLGPKTQLLVEPSYTQYVYPNSLEDNDVVRVMAGVTWEATAKTTGIFKVGRHEKTFDNFDDDQEGLSLQGTVIWKPKSYSVVTASISRDVYDLVLPGTHAYEALVASLDWEHELTPLTQLQSGVRLENADYYDTAGREDDLLDLYVGVSYALRRNLTVGARYDHARRDSNIAGNDYRDNRVAIGVKTTFD